jgi:hypothetical protein
MLTLGFIQLVSQIALDVSTLFQGDTSPEARSLTTCYKACPTNCPPGISPAQQAIGTTNCTLQGNLTYKLEYFLKEKYRRDSTRQISNFRLQCKLAVLRARL